MTSCHSYDVNRNLDDHSCNSEYKIPMPDLSFIILTWNSDKYLKKCFESVLRICRSNSISCEIIIVDNGSSDKTLEITERFARLYQDLFTVIALGCNRGTTYTRNLGLRKAQGTFVCILDSDTEILDGDLVNILDRLSEQPLIGIIAPKLILGDGTIQNSVKKFPTFWLKLLKILKVLFRIQGLDKDFYNDFPFQHETEVDSAISACWFFHRNLLKTVGLLDENIFYSPEDVDFCLRVWISGSSVLYVPSFTVMHYTQQISHKRPLSLVSIRHFTGLLYYFMKHGGWVAAPRFAVPFAVKR